MSIRASRLMPGGNGGVVEYEGDLTPPVTTYASAAPKTPMSSRMFVPGTTALTGAPVVFRGQRRGGHRFFYSHGAVPMPPALPGPSGVGQVRVSLFQRFNMLLADWMINAAWREAGVPQNLGWSSKTPQLETNVTGGPGSSRQTTRPLFPKVQQVPRARARVGTYPTRGSRA